MNKNLKTYSSAPLPFQGQKRRFVPAFKEALRQFDDKTVFVDLFGGSGLLSHTIKRQRPDARVIYNDYDDYHIRLQNIDKTNALLAELRAIIGDAPRAKRLPEQTRSAILKRVQQEDEAGFVDYIALSTSLLFAMNYMKDFNELSEQALYNNITQNDYNCDDYLTGLELVKFDYIELYNQYKDDDNVVFIVDPPYLSTNNLTYENYWRLTQCLNVITVLKGTSYFYFTSNKSEIMELYDWLKDTFNVQNPFIGAKQKDIYVNSYSIRYFDIMLYKHT